MDLVAIPGAKLVVSEGKGYTDVYQEMVRGKFPCEVKPEKEEEGDNIVGMGKNSSIWKSKSARLQTREY